MAFFKVLLVGTMLGFDSLVVGQELFTTQGCPLIPSCCEDDCCDPGTVWASPNCVADPGSPGWAPGLNSPEYEFGCVARECCEADCCGAGTVFDAGLGCCVPANVCQNAGLADGEPGVLVSCYKCGRVLDCFARTTDPAVHVLIANFLTVSEFCNDNDSVKVDCGGNQQDCEAPVGDRGFTVLNMTQNSGFVPNPTPGGGPVCPTGGMDLSNVAEYWVNPCDGAITCATEKCESGTCATKVAPFCAGQPWCGGSSVTV